MIRVFIKWYSYITTGILIVTAVNFAISSEGPIPEYTLWKVLLSGLLTTIVTMLFYRLGEPDSIIKMWCRILLHYLSLSAVMILCGYWFGWLDLNVAGIAMMLVSVGGVYFLAFSAHYIVDLKQTKKLNEKLKEKYSDEERPVNHNIEISEKQIESNQVKDAKESLAETRSKYGL